MPSNQIALWLGAMSATATPWEVGASLLGVLACGVALWSAIDNVFDIRYVRMRGRIGGPRWITARWFLIANVLFLLGWLGYTHVAVSAAYLPPRTDTSDATMSGIAVMRVGYGLFGLLAQAALRVMRTKLRNLSREQWATLFGEANRFETLYHEERAASHALRADVYAARARAHQMTNRTAAAESRNQMLVRLCAQHNIDVPPALLSPDPGRTPGG